MNLQNERKGWRNWVEEQRNMTWKKCCTILKSFLSRFFVLKKNPLHIMVGWSVKRHQRRFKQKMYRVSCSSSREVIPESTIKTVETKLWGFWLEIFVKSWIRAPFHLFSQIFLVFYCFAVACDFLPLARIIFLKNRGIKFSGKVKTQHAWRKSVLRTNWNFHSLPGELSVVCANNCTIHVT